MTAPVVAVPAWSHLVQAAFRPSARQVPHLEHGPARCASMRPCPAVVVTGGVLASLVDMQGIAPLPSAQSVNDVSHIAAPAVAAGVDHPDGRETAGTAAAGSSVADPVAARTLAAAPAT